MEWEKEWEKIKCFATQSGGSIGFENNKDIDFISTQIEKAVEENESAQKLLWDRMENWEKEWRSENPKERELRVPDALKLIEWKIEKAIREERKIWVSE